MKRKGRRKQRKTQIKAYKRRLKEAVKKAEQGVEYAMDFVLFISDKLKRNGELKKREIRSNKQRQEINRAIELFESAKQAEVETAKKEQGLINAGYAENTAEAKEIISAFAVLSENEMKDKLGFSCAQIISIAQENEKLSSENLRKVAEWLIREREERTPSYLREYLNEDDNYKLLDYVIDILDNEKITPEELEDAFSEEPTREMRKRMESDAFDLSGFLENFRR